MRGRCVASSSKQHLVGRELAMLEAFVHDPLVDWRLLNTGNTAAEPIAKDFSHLDLTGHGPDQAADAIESAESAELAGSMPLPPRRDVRERKLITAYGALDPRTDSSSNCHEKLCQSNIGCCPFW
ncbi:hypothetical protein WJX74_008794 [Apatococcus lobatus]|uniref:Uncharacterized protein n=1 Tax=Apatococcus lobatus TaxID=904363 RepID=A0AAW1RW22_9CHLO